MSHYHKSTNVSCNYSLHQFTCNVFQTEYCVAAWEKKSLQASAMAQTELGAPVIIHPGRHPKAPEEIVRILHEAGGDISRTVMSHIDRM